LRLLQEKKDIRWSEELFEHDIHAAKHLGQKKVIAGLVKNVLSLVKTLRSG